MEFTFNTDEDTTKLFEVVVWCLERYFGHDHATAVSLVNGFYPRNLSGAGDDYYHHEGPYPTAAEVHYLEFMRGEPEGLHAWKLAGGYHQPPREAIDYFNEHYFEQ